VRLIDDCCSVDLAGSVPYLGGLVSFTCGTPPAIDVSGMPTFRGGGRGSEPNEYGWYAVLVCILRLEDMRVCEEENVRRTCWQGRRGDVAGEAANRYTKLDDDVNGARTRCADIL